MKDFLKLKPQNIKNFYLKKERTAGEEVKCALINNFHEENDKP